MARARADICKKQAALTSGPGKVTQIKPLNAILASVQKHRMLVSVYAANALVRVLSIPAEGS